MTDLSLIIINKCYCFYSFNISNDLKTCSYVMLGEARWPTNRQHVNKVSSLIYILTQNQIQSLTIILQAFSKARKRSQVTQNVLWIIHPIASVVLNRRNVEIDVLQDRRKGLGVCFKKSLMVFMGHNQGPLRSPAATTVRQRGSSLLKTWLWFCVCLGAVWFLFYGNPNVEMVYGKTKQQPKYHLKISSSARLVALASRQLQIMAHQLVHPPGMCLWLLFAISGGKKRVFFMYLHNIEI